MRKFILVLALMCFTCSGDDEANECMCRGEFQLISEAGTAESFFSDNVECETGEPIITHQLDMGNPVSYLGCDEVMP